MLLLIFQGDTSKAEDLAVSLFPLQSLLKSDSTLNFRSEGTGQCCQENSTHIHFLYCFPSDFFFPFLSSPLLSSPLLSSRLLSLLLSSPLLSSPPLLSSNISSSLLFYSFSLFSLSFLFTIVFCSVLVLFAPSL